jgi:hypothetical protein
MCNELNAMRFLKRSDHWVSRFRCPDWGPYAQLTTPTLLCFHGLDVAVVGRWEFLAAGMGQGWKKKRMGLGLLARGLVCGVAGPSEWGIGALGRGIRILKPGGQSTSKTMLHLIHCAYLVLALDKAQVFKKWLLIGWPHWLAQLWHSNSFHLILLNFPCVWSSGVFLVIFVCEPKWLSSMEDVENVTDHH